MMKAQIILLTCFFFLPILGSKAQNAGGFPEEYIRNISKVAPHIPHRPNRFDRYATEEASAEHRIAMDKWATAYPEELKQAILLDSYLNIFIQTHSTAADKTDPWPYPEFMRYPLTTDQKPVLQDSGNPERDKRHFENETQHWYFLHDKVGYVEKYGALPIIEQDTPIKQ